MWGRSTKEKKVTKINSLIAKETEVKGDIYFEGGLHVDGRVKGNVLGKEGCQCILTLSVDGYIEGNVRTDNAILNGQIVGDVYVTEHLELAVNARIKGNVYYNLIEMAMGAEVNGSLVHYSPEKHRGQLPTVPSTTPESLNPEQFANPELQSK
jgi:cytoskeletal protein CcmA (bactofilin family)